jgi:hypothetical protein
MNPKTFNPDRLKIVMMRRQIKAPELAQKIGKKSSKVQRYVLGINEPSEIEVKKISAALNWPEGFFYLGPVSWPDWSSI